jgi:uncharacterized membrane protein
LNTRKLPVSLMLALVLLLAVFLRLIALGSRTLWYDEAFAVLFSEKGLSAMLYGTLTSSGGSAADVHPLLYYTSLGAWMSAFGENPAAVRLFSVLCGVATIAVLYVLVRDLFGERTGILAALITALAPFDVQYSQEARMYALFGLLLVSATWCYVRSWRSGRLRYWIAFGILAGLAMYTQQLAAFYLAALGFIPILFRHRAQLVRVAFGAAIALLIYLPWLVNLPAQLGKLAQYWIPQPGIGQPLITLWFFTLGDYPVTAAISLVISSTTLILLLVLLLYRANNAFRWRTLDSKPLGFVLYLVFVPMALMWVFSQWRPVYLARGLLPSALMYYVALAWLLTRARLPRPIGIGVAALCGITAALGLATHYTWDNFPNAPFDRADQYIAAHFQPGDRVVHADKITVLPMVYYNRALLPQAYIGDAAGSGTDTLALPTQQVLSLLADDCPAAASAGSQRIWFVIFQEQITQQGGASPQQAWFDAHYQQASVQNFNDLRVLEYTQPDAVAVRTAHTSCEAGS